MARPRPNPKPNAKPTPPGTSTLPSGADIAQDALTYAGHYGYVWGGTDAQAGDWDCSAFVSWVLGHDLGLTLPGGIHFGDPGGPGGGAHGPVVGDYYTWNGATTLGASEAAEAGDLVIWPPDGHIGICTGANSMVSALDTSLGTIASPIVGYGPSSTIVYRRINGVGQTPSGDGGTGGGLLGDALTSVVGPVAAGLLVAGGLIVGTLLLATLVGLGGAAVIGAILSRAGANG